MCNVLGNVPSILAKDVAVNSNGNIRVGAAVTQNKSKVAEKKKGQENSMKAFGAQAGAAMTVFAVGDSTEQWDGAGEIGEKTTETEAKQPTAGSAAAAGVFAILPLKQKGQIAALEKEMAWGQRAGGVPASNSRSPNSNTKGR